MSDIKAEFKKVGKGQEVLVIEIPIEEKESTTGKTLLIASTAGSFKTGLKYKGKEVTLGLNAWVKK